MKSHLTAIELRHCIAELQELCHGRMDKIYQPTPEELLFQIHLPNKGRVLLKFIKGKFLYRTMHKQEIPLQPSSFCMYLRKRLGNARITAIQQVNFERVVLIVLETKEQQYHFYAELFGKGNFLLCDHEDTILLPLEVQKWKDREVKPRMAYLLPKQEHNPLQLQEEELPALHANAGKSLVKTLAVDLGLGGVYAEEFCLVAKLDKEKQTITTEESKRIYSLLQQLVEKKTDARVVLQNNSVLDIVPFPLEIYAAMEQKAFPSFNEALDTCLSQQQNAETKEKAVKGISLQLGKYEKIVEKQSEQVVSLEKQIQENQRKGELLYEHYQSIQGLLQRIQELRKKHPWKEIEKKVKEECPFVQSIQEREGKITIEL